MKEKLINALVICIAIPLAFFGLPYLCITATSHTASVLYFVAFVAVLIAASGTDVYTG